MAVLNQFQKYSKEEDTVTNNVLLMLSNLYEINPKYYEEYIRGLTEDVDSYEVIPSFLQQVNNRGNGRIDGHIQVRASKIIIETKLHGFEWIEKLLKYADSFDEKELKLLFHLSSEKYPQHKIDEINKRLKENKTIGKMNFLSLTYQNLVDQLKELANNYQFEHYLQRLNEHFESYCLGMSLMPKSNHILRAMACGQSFDLNVKHKFYFDLASRGYSNFNYLGIYKWKSVRYIGRVENMIVANWDETNGLEVLEQKFELTDNQKERLINAIKESVQSGWDVANGLRFFLLKDFEKTDFAKTTPGGMLRVRFFNLEEYIGKVPKKMKVKEIAEMLKSKSWK